MCSWRKNAENVLLWHKDMHEHGTVCQPSLEHQIRLCAPSSVISRPTCFSSSLRCCWLSTVRPAPLWLFSEFGAVYKYSDLLTYLLIYCVIYTLCQTQHMSCFISSTSWTFIWQSRCCISPQILVNQVQSWIVGSHRSSETKMGVFHSRRLIVSKARCIGALSCWKIKNSPEISCMTGSSCSVSSTSSLLLLLKM